MPLVSRFGDKHLFLYVAKENANTRDFEEIKTHQIEQVIHSNLK